jgi:deoxyribodipyrimidine photolyase
MSANVGNWQWAAGTGCDAAPYFEDFNPEIQQFDEKNLHQNGLKFDLGYGKPMVEHAMARDRAIATYRNRILRNKDKLNRFYISCDLHSNTYRKGYLFFFYLNKFLQHSPRK